MPMLALFGAEVLATEVAAATAAEIAAAEAAKIAAAEAASVAAAEAAASAAAQTAAQAAAQQTAQAGIMGIEGAAANAPLTAEAAQTAAMNSGLPAAPPTAPPAGLEAISPAQEAYLQASSANSMQGITPGVQPLPAYPNDFQSVNQIANQVASQVPPAPISLTPPPPPPSGLEAGFDKALKFAEKNPLTAMTGAYMGASALGFLDPSSATFNNEKYDGPLSRYRLSPDFKPGSANPANFQYAPRYANGGIMGMGAMPQQARDIQVGYNEGGMAPDVPSYAKGGSLTDSIEQYQKMLAGDPMKAPAVSRDVGIYRDEDPDTRYQDPLTAAQIRQSKINQRAYVTPPVAKRPTPMGQLQMASVKPRKQSGDDDVEAAQGGIMHSSLGGYAAGGKSRLLKGPGDGMSDNIPATINGRQPARLADGEFVIPADVVSHLGNGSTEAGAKQLHAMMDKIRKARTGNSKQGKQINPRKYMPK